MEKEVSLVVVKRLPRYYRYLTELADNGITRISSSALGEKMGVTASQIRQDLNCFGGFGQQGYGYNVELLRNTIGELLGLDKHYRLIIIGAGHLGHALANYAGFQKRGFRLIGIFDNSEKVVGDRVGSLTVKHTGELESFFAEEKPEIAILALPKAAAKEMGERLADLGIKGIWNFSHTDMAFLNERVAVENVHLSDSLMTLAYRVAKDE